LIRNENNVLREDNCPRRPSRFTSELRFGRTPGKVLNSTNTGKKSALKENEIFLRGKEFVSNLFLPKRTTFT